MFGGKERGSVTSVHPFSSTTIQRMSLIFCMRHAAKKIRIVLWTIIGERGGGCSTLSPLLLFTATYQGTDQLSTDWWGGEIFARFVCQLSDCVTVLLSLWLNIDPHCRLPSDYGWLSSSLSFLSVWRLVLCNFQSICCLRCLLLCVCSCSCKSSEWFYHFISLHHFTHVLYHSLLVTLVPPLFFTRAYQQGETILHFFHCCWPPSFFGLLHHFFSKPLPLKWASEKTAVGHLIIWPSAASDLCCVSWFELSDSKEKSFQ